MDEVSYAGATQTFPVPPAVNQLDQADQQNRLPVTHPSEPKETVPTYAD